MHDPANTLHHTVQCTHPALYAHRFCGSLTGDTFAADGMAPVAPKWSDRYLTTGLESDIDTGLRRMADVRPEWIDKTCANCKTVCSDGAYEAPSGALKGKPVCEACLTKLFSLGECASCHGHVVPDGGEYVKDLDDKIYHAHCFSSDRRCYVCRQPLLGQPGVNALGRDYHAKCFQCGSCQTKLDGAFVAVAGVPHCSECASDAQTSRLSKYGHQATMEKIIASC